VPYKLVSGERWRYFTDESDVNIEPMGLVLLMNKRCRPLRIGRRKVEGIRFGILRGWSGDAVFAVTLGM